MDKLSPNELNERLSIALGIEPDVTWMLVVPSIKLEVCESEWQPEAEGVLRYQKARYPDGIIATDGEVISRKVYHDLQGTWQGMGEVIEAMAKRGWWACQDYDIGGAYAKFVHRADVGIFVAHADRPPRAVALAALSALSQEVG